MIYWFLHAGGWSALLAVHLLALSAADQLTVSMVAGHAAAVTLGGIYSDRLRRRSLRRAWFAESARHGWLRAAPACALGGVLIVGASLLLELALDNRPGPLSQPGRFVTATSYWSAILCVYFLIHSAVVSARRSRRQEEKRWKLESVLRETELQALRTQLDPHFLFNSLNSIRALVEEDPEHARAAITHLSALLRYSLGSQNRPLVPLANEVEAVRRYLSLEQLRLEERLEVDWRLDEATLSEDIAPLLLQTLVENAVRHGIAVRPEGGCLSIVTQANGESWQLEIRNPGEWKPEATDGALAGVGLRNTRERLRLLYDGRASLDIVAEEDEIVTAVTLPRKAS